MATHEEHDPAELRLLEDNPHRNDLAEIKKSLRVNGQYRTIVVNRGTKTGRPLEVLAGNHTLMGIRELAVDRPKDKRWKSVDCTMVDLDDAAAARLTLADNKTGTTGEDDDRAVLRLLEKLDGDVAGSGYVDDDVDDLRAILEEADTDIDDLVRAGEEGLPSTPTTPPPGADSSGAGRPADDSPLPQFSDEEKPPAAASTDNDPGMGRNRSLEDLATGYEASPTRLFMISYPIPHFVWMQERLTDIGKSLGLDNNADIMRALVESETGISAPVLEDK